MRAFTITVFIPSGLDNGITVSHMLKQLSERDDIDSLRNLEIKPYTFDWLHGASVSISVRET